MYAARNQRISRHVYATRSSARRAAKKFIGKAMQASDPYLADSGPSITYADCNVTSDKIDCAYSMVHGWIIVREDMVSIIEDSETGGYRWCVEWWLEDLVWDVDSFDYPEPKLTFRELINWAGPRDKYGWPQYA